MACPIPEAPRELDFRVMGTRASNAQTTQGEYVIATFESERENVMESTANEAARVQPRFVRLAEACKAVGIQRTRTYELLNEAKGKIKTLVLKSPGSKKGARLIHLPSLFAYLDEMAEEQRKG